MKVVWLAIVMLAAQVVGAHETFSASATLDEVVRHYDTGFVTRPSLAPEVKALQLSDQEVKNLVAFLETLTGQDPPMATPVLP